MLRLERLPGPPGAVLELDADEISDLAVHAITYDTDHLALGIADSQLCIQRNCMIQLQTRPRKGYIFKIRDGPVCPSRLIIPLDVYQVRAQHARLETPILHTLLIVGERGEV